MTTPLFDAATSWQLTLALWHTCWFGILVAGLAALGNRLLRKAPAWQRYWLNFVALAAIGGCLPVSFLLVRATNAKNAESPIVARAMPAAPTESVASDRDAFGPLAGESDPVEPTGFRPPRDDESAIAERPADFERLGAKPQGAEWESLVHVAAPYVTAVYLLGVIAMLGKLIVAIYGGKRLRVGSLPIVEPRLLGIVARQSRRLALNFVPAVACCERIAVPVVVGIVRPMILVPAGMLTGMAPDELSALLTHELAHIRRHDHWLILLQRCLEALLFFHPAAWYLSRRMHAERENCCDDLVVAAGGDRLVYAQSLLRVAESRLKDDSRRKQLVALAADGRQPSQLRQRIARLLGEASEPSVRFRNRWPAILLGLVCACALWGVAANAWQAIAETKDKDDESRTARGGNDSAAAKNQKPDDPPAAAPQPKTHPISLKGRALDPDGEPLAGARIYVASVAADWRRIAETITDAEGRYDFRDVPLPIERATTNAGRDVGAFEVFGQAKGFGFSWRPRMAYFPDRAAEDFVQEGPADLPDRFEADDKIDLDLKFSAAASLSGRIVDERGKPIAGTTLALRYCEPLGVAPGQMRFGFSALNQREDVPAEMKLRTTDAQGRFTFAELPKDCLFRIDVRPPGFPSRWIYAATSDEPQPDYQQSPVLTRDLELTFVTPLNVPIQVLYGDTGKPAAKVLVEGLNAEASSHLASDGEGRVTLRLPPGEYRLNLLPAQKTPYLVTDERFVVGEEAPREPHVARLRPAGVLEITVEDEESREGVPNVDLWREVALPVAANAPRARELLYFRSYEMETRIAHVERPRTDAKGKMRALVEPGKHVIGVGLEAYPRDYAFVGSGVAVECEAGETVEVTFKVRKRGAAPVRGALDEPGDQGGAARNRRAAPNLDQPTTVNFDGIELEDALKILADFHDINIRKDTAALKAAKISLADAPRITLKLNGVSLRSVLKLMLEPCGLEARMGQGELVIVPRAREAPAAADKEQADPRLPEILTQAAEHGATNFEAIKTAHIKFRSSRGAGSYKAGLTPERCRELLDKYDLVERPEQLGELIGELFDGGRHRPRPWVDGELHVTGKKIRESMQYSDHGPDVHITDGEISLRWNEANSQLNIDPAGESRIYQMGLRDFWRPFRVPGVDNIERTVRARGVLTLSGAGGAGWRHEIAADEATGLVLRVTSQNGNMGILEQEHWLGWQTGAGGIPYPTVVARLDYRDNQLSRTSFLVVREMRLNGPIADSVFRMGAPAGSAIFDSRPDGVIGGGRINHDVFDVTSREQLIEASKPLDPEPRTPQEKFAVAELARIYALADNEVLKRIAPPYPASRKHLPKLLGERYMSARRPIHSHSIRWENGKPTSSWGFAGGSFRFRNLIENLLKLKSTEIEGDPERLMREIPGDYVYRAEAPPERLAESLAEIASLEFGRPIRLVSREVQRPVYVARGALQLALPDGKYIALNGGPHSGAHGEGIGFGKLDRLLDEIGAYIHTPVVNEAEPSALELSWSSRWYDLPDTPAEKRFKLDPQVVLKQITEQTGITFTPEDRMTRVLFVEMAK